MILRSVSNFLYYRVSSANTKDTTGVCLDIVQHIIVFVFKIQLKFA